MFDGLEAPSSAICDRKPLHHVSFRSCSPCSAMLTACSPCQSITVLGHCITALVHNVSKEDRLLLSHPDPPWHQDKFRVSFAESEVAHLADVG